MRHIHKCVPGIKYLGNMKPGIKLFYLKVCMFFKLEFCTNLEITQSFTALHYSRDKSGEFSLMCLGLTVEKRLNIVSVIFPIPI